MSIERPDRYDAGIAIFPAQDLSGVGADLVCEAAQHNVQRMLTGMRRTIADVRRALADDGACRSKPRPVANW